MEKKILHLLASNSYSGAENVACTIIENLSGEYDMVYCCPRGTIEENLGEKRIRFLPLKKLSFFEVNRAIREYKPDIIIFESVERDSLKLSPAFQY